MRKISEYLSRWWIALLVTIALAAAILLPAINRPGLWENTERALADRVAPPEDIQLQQDKLKKQADEQMQAAKRLKPLAQRKLLSCRRAPPEDPVARSLTNRAMTWGRDRIADSDGGRKLPLALLGLLTVIATAGIAMRLARPRAGIVTAVVLLSMPLLVLQSRMLTIFPPLMVRT